MTTTNTNRSIMKTFFAFAVVSMLALLHGSSVEGLTTSTTNININVTNHRIATSSTTSSSSTQLFFFGAAKDDGSPGDYVCKDCGYVFTGGPKKWAALDDSKYKCPPCGAPKFRFKKVKKGSESGEVKVKKSWF